MRLLVVMMAVVANSMQTRGKLRQMVSMRIGTNLEIGSLHQQADSASVVLRGVLQNSQERTGRRLDDIVDVASNEQQNDEENGSSDGTDTHTGNHNLGALH